VTVAETSKAGLSDLSDGSVRRYDFDWLRVLAVLLLFPFHTGRVFDTFGDWYVRNLETSDAITLFQAYVWRWHMPLLFVLAGAASWYALGKRRAGQYAWERVKRLLVPLIFGLLVIVPPQSWLGLRSHSVADPSFWAWYPNFFSFHAADPDGYRLGGFTLAHLWFILFLFVFAVVALPLMVGLRRPGGSRVIEPLARVSSVPGVILLAAVPWWLTVNLIDYPNPVYFLIVFLTGYVLLSDPRFGQAIDRHRHVALLLGPIAFLPLAYWETYGWPDWMSRELIDLATTYAEGFAPWFFLIAILGYGRHLLNRSGRVLNYLSEASYPYYILHQTLIVAIAFFVVRWDTSLGVKYVAILIGAGAATAVLYELIVKRTRITRALFGMRAKPASTPERSASGDSALASRPEGR